MYSKYRKKNNIHYIVTEQSKNVEQWIYVFDYENLMLYLLNSTENLSNKDIYYIDKLCRGYKTKDLYVEGSHKLNISKLIKQAYEYEHKYLMKEKYIDYLDIYMFPSREWHSLFQGLPICESDWIWNNRLGYCLPYRRKSPKSHSQCSYGIPKHMWNKVKTSHILASVANEYDEDYSQYFTHKTRYSKSCLLGWWDDYSRRNKSAGWKESTKRKHQWKIKKENEE